MKISKFNPIQSNNHTERVSPRDLVGTLLVINVREFKPAVVTKFEPGGKDAIAIDVASVETGNVALDQLWFNGALVDALKAHVGTAVPVKLEWQKSATSGYSYLTVIAVDDSDQVKAEEWLDANPTAFNPVSQPVSESAGGATAGRW